MSNPPSSVSVPANSKCTAKFWPEIITSASKPSRSAKGDLVAIISAEACVTGPNQT